MFIQQRDNILWHRTNAVLRLGLYKGLGNWAGDYYAINEYPKSGGTWVTQMVSEMLRIPAPRNRLPVLGSSILHGHQMTRPGVKKTIMVWRDGRDVATSWYYHQVIGNELFGSATVEYTRQAAGITNPSDIEDSFPKAMRYFLDQPRYPRHTWAQFVDRWSDYQPAIHIRYEDLKTDTPGELIKIANFLDVVDFEREKAVKIADQFSFAKQTGRKAGEAAVGKFLRKGVVGDWQNHFDQPTRELFHEKAGQQLIKLGYEKDDSWVKR